MDHRARPHVAQVRRPVRPILLILLLSLPTLFAGLGQASLWETDEPLYVEASRQMLNSGDFLTPVFNGEPRFEKPILFPTGCRLTKFYWLLAGDHRMVGAPASCTVRCRLRGGALRCWVAPLESYGRADGRRRPPHDVPRGGVQPAGAH